MGHDLHLDGTRVDELLKELLDLGGTPEEVCRTCPELLPDVRAKWQRLRVLMLKVSAMFPQCNSLEGAIAGDFRPLELPRIPGYEVQRVLGHGGMGVVYQARHLRLNRPVAVKMLLSGPYAAPQERERFSREAEAVAGLRHANIVQVYDVGEVEGRSYFTMEYVEGGSLAQTLAGTPQPARQAAAIVATLAEAIGVAHQNGIVHRDLKPGNILLTFDGSPKITDFGLVRLESGNGLTLTGVVLGTPSYMSPEQARGDKGAIGPAVDVYALGAILYECLTGRPPFRAETATATIQQVVADEPAPPARLNPRVPRDLETICLKCLQKDPAGRYASAAALADDLHRFGRGDPIAARPLHSLQRCVRWVRRNPSQGALVVTMMALLALGLGAAMWQGRQRAERLAEQARLEGRASQALDTALEHAVALKIQGRWPEVRAELQGAARLLELSSSANVRRRMQQALADSDMVVELEDIRLRLSEGGIGQEKPGISPDQAYADALGRYGIVLTAPDLETTVTRIRNSAIRETLLAFLHDWLYWVSGENRDKLRALLDQVDDDEWRRDFRQAYTAKDADRLRWLSRADQAVTQPTVVLSGLAGSLAGGQYKLEALTLLQAAQQRHPDDFWLNYLLGKHWYDERSQEAIGYCRAAVAIRPGSDQAYVLLGNAMRNRGDMVGTKAAYRKALALNPNCNVARDLASAEDQQNGLEEARVVWERLLENDPRNHNAWYGYSELCLYLDNREAYFEARKRLLQIFGETLNDWIVAERTSTACLLMPASGDELLRAGILAEVAVMSAAKNPDAGNPYVMFAKGLAEYRQGRYERAIPLLQIVAEKLSNRPASRLVLAMAQFEFGLLNDARKTMAAAIRAYDWSESSPAFRKDAVTAWANHVLRRQAEELILPNFQAFRREEYQPQDNDERIALLGVCQFERRYVAAARLYVEAFAANPHLADELAAECLARTSAAEHPDNPLEVFNAACRYQAACCAAQAGQALGTGGEQHSPAELLRWRRQAREWLQEDLVAWIPLLNSESQAIRDVAKKILEHFQVDLRLAGLRDANLLEKLSPEEQKECRSLWNQVALGLKHKKKS